MASRLGRPLGGFEKHTADLLQLLGTEPNPIRYTDIELSQKLTLGVRQIRRYLTQLKNGSKIEIQRHRYGLGAGHWVNARTITVIKNEVT